MSLISDSFPCGFASREIPPAPLPSVSCSPLRPPTFPTLRLRPFAVQTVEFAHFRQDSLTARSTKLSGRVRSMFLTFFYALLCVL